MYKVMNSLITGYFAGRVLVRAVLALRHSMESAVREADVVPLGGLWGPEPGVRASLEALDRHVR